MRILHLLDHSIPLHSGYTFRTRNIIEQQRAMGWETFHLTGPKHIHPSGLEEDVDGLHFYRTGQLSGVMSKLPVLNQYAVIASLASRLKQIIPEVKPDIIHAHSPALNGLAALKAAQRHGIPVVYEVRAFWEDAAVDHGTSREGGVRYRMTRALETSVLRRADAVTTICEGLRQDIIARGIAEDKVTVIPNAVDLEKFTTDNLRDEKLAEELDLVGKRVLGFIGSFYAYEGLPLLLEALPTILKSYPQARVLLVGGGPDEENLKNKAEELGISDKVKFVGWVPHDQVQRYYNLVDILVYPRYSMRLTELVTPLKPLEAMAQGRLLVASDVGGHHELIRDGENGRLFKAGDADSLVATILELLESETYWPALHSAARHYVETERNWPISVAHYQHVYEYAMNHKGNS